MSHINHAVKSAQIFQEKVNRHKAAFFFPKDFFFSSAIFEEISKLIDRVKFEKSQLFLENLTLYTEDLSPEEVNRLMELLNTIYEQVEITSQSKQGRYIGSDGYGHYSNDYYEWYNYTMIKLFFDPNRPILDFFMQCRK